MKPKFKVGDKVIAKNAAPYGITTNGWKGVVTTAESDNGFMCVAGMMVKSKYFDLDKSCCQKIVITTDGKTATAALYNGKQRIKDAKATCASGDKFDFGTGAKIAFERLMGYAPCALDTRFDWNEFKAGKITVKVTEDNFRDFVTEAKKHDLVFNPDEDFNPFNELADKLFRAVLSHIDVKENEIYVMYDDGSLKIGHFLGDSEEFVW